MPRKSAAELSTPSIPCSKPTARSPAPTRLRDLPGAVALWDEITGAYPADYFRGGQGALLEDLVRSVVAQRTISAQIARASKNLEARGGINRLDALLKMEERQVRLAAMLATKLRITNQSRLSARAAANAAKPAGKKPWDQ